MAQCVLLACRLHHREKIAGNQYDALILGDRRSQMSYRREGLTGTKRASVRGLEDQRRPHQESKTTDALRPSDLLLFIDFQQPQQLGQAQALTGTKL
ncbi:hypothetical protein BO79DRAFT_252727 [Aspergillus costaricaensis CBS 115574]|uniref:Uncharacterized protein n=1 Tax=Aspergillus costaricaensis CBS 115574 TaxID=1448317 RepID=A0ACD1ILT2_9EURO|nr:hypothetical protein BO79DRAFT_252727 [Aspergillus costaricaensis CBS 115574]RAK91204.1 hypothetical protein BO79DRAFT_252727 [Aspergillus costaricaensis CBS 115574]